MGVFSGARARFVWAGLTWVDGRCGGWVRGCASIRTPALTLVRTPGRTPGRCVGMGVSGPDHADGAAVESGSSAEVGSRRAGRAAASRSWLACPSSGRGGRVCRVNAGVVLAWTTRRAAAVKASRWARSCSSSSGSVCRARRGRLQGSRRRPPCSVRSRRSRGRSRGGTGRGPGGRG